MLRTRASGWAWRHSVIAAKVASHSWAASCSTQPGAGTEMPTGDDATKIGRPVPGWTSRAFVFVVPWSSARMTPSIGSRLFTAFSDAGLAAIRVAAYSQDGPSHRLPRGLTVPAGQSPRL